MKLALRLSYVSDEFYRGSVARDLAAWFRDVGITLELEDLNIHTSTWVEPFSTNYRGYDVCRLPLFVCCNATKSHVKCPLYWILQFLAVLFVDRSGAWS